MKYRPSKLRRFAAGAALACAFVLAPGAAPAAEKVLVIFEEQVKGIFGLSGSWVDPGQAEAGLIAELQAAGFDVVDGATVRANLSREQAVSVLAGDEKAAVAAGSRFQATYVVIGNGFAKSAGNVLGSSMKSMQGQVNVKLVQAQSGSVLATAAESSAQAHVDELTGGTLALKTAGALAAGKLVAALERAADAPAAAAAPLHVTISGLRSYRHFLFLKEWIETNTADFNGFASENYTTGSGDLDVQTGVRGPDFAKRIALATFDGFVVNPVDVSEGAVSLKVITREP